MKAEERKEKDKSGSCRQCSPCCLLQCRSGEIKCKS